MARIVHILSNARDRKKILRQLAAISKDAAEEYENWKDITAYVLFALMEIRFSVDNTTNAWEKRGFWLKSDRFRRE